MLKYFLWYIWRLHSSTVSQHIPGWTGFISETGQVSKRFTTINYHPIIDHLTTVYSTVQECLRAGVSNSQPSEPFNAARETILKFLINFTSCHRTRFLINEAWRRAMVWRWWRGNDLFFLDRHRCGLRYRNRCPEKWWSPNRKTSCSPRHDCQHAM